MQRKQPFYTSTLTADLDQGVLSATVAVPPPALAAGQYYVLTLADDPDPQLVTVIENVRVTAVTGNVLTLSARGVENTSDLDWLSGAVITCCVTQDSLERPEGVIHKDPRYVTHVATSSSFDASNGPMQTRTAAGDETIEVTLAPSDGSILLVKYIPGAHTISLGSSISGWIGPAPSIISASHWFGFLSIDGGATVLGIDMGADA